MAIKLTYHYRVPQGTVDHHAVFSHLQDVLNVFASKSDCTKFYIGITNNLKRRRREHQADRPEYTLMCAIYKEEEDHIEDRFHNLEREAIRRFQRGVRNKATHQVLRCDNEPGQKPHNWLYILVDKRDVADIPINSSNPGLWGDEK
ncbi:MAG: GIY-YIG nuclease family protein [Leptospiraceae bacterium]|nr:GIY-YIG nuclease family protein [Leptospiraceae bacterium]